MKFTTAQQQELISVIKKRFDHNPKRHDGIDWAFIQSRLEAAPENKLQSLAEMERTGGEPDVIRIDEQTGELVFFDCAAESPTGRRSLCYDQAALDSRKENKPAGSVIQMAANIGIELMSEDQYRHLQTLGSFDNKTSSWIQTPGAVRKLGGSLFGDRRYDHVFIYHNGASSYYAARGFRGCLFI